MKKNKIIIVVVIGLLIICFGLFYIDKNINFSLVGDEEYFIEVNSEYIEHGFKIYIFNKDLSNYVYVKSDVNDDVVGNYKIKYVFSFLFFRRTLERNVIVVDRTVPELKLIGNDIITMYVNESYNELGAVANDNYDGDLTDKIKITTDLDILKTGTYYVNYYVEDSSRNSNSVSRTIIVKNKETIKNVCNYTNDISRYICKNNLNVSVGYYNLVTDETYFYNKDKVYFGASLIKTLDALYLYDKNMINDELKEYVRLAISKSDNNAHNYLLNYIGKDNLKNYGMSLGAKYVLTDNGVNGYTTVDDQIIFLKKLYDLTNSNNYELKLFFINDYGNYLKFNDNINVMHKYGYYGNVYHDVGIILDEEPYIIVVLTEEANDDFKSIINKISTLVYDYHTS